MNFGGFTTHSILAYGSFQTVSAARVSSIFLFIGYEIPVVKHHLKRQNLGQHEYVLDFHK